MTEQPSCIPRPGPAGPVPRTLRNAPCVPYTARRSSRAPRAPRPTAEVRRSRATSAAAPQENGLFGWDLGVRGIRALRRRRRRRRHRQLLLHTDPGQICSPRPGPHLLAGPVPRALRTAPCVPRAARGSPRGGPAPRAPRFARRRRASAAEATTAATEQPIHPYHGDPPPPSSSGGGHDISVFVAHFARAAEIASGSRFVSLKNVYLKNDLATILVIFAWMNVIKHGLKDLASGSHFFLRLEFEEPSCTKSSNSRVSEIYVNCDCV